MASETFRIDVPIRETNTTDSNVLKGIQNLTRFDKVSEKTQKQLEKLNNGTYNLVIEAVDKASGPLEAIMDLVSEFKEGIQSTIEMFSKINIPEQDFDKFTQNTNMPNFSLLEILSNLSNNKTADKNENRSISTERSEQASGPDFASDLRSFRDAFNIFKGGAGISAYFEKLEALNTLARDSKSALEHAVIEVKNSKKVFEEAKQIKITKKSHYKEILKNENVASDIKSKSLIEFQESNKNYRTARKNRDVNYSNLKEAKQLHKSKIEAIDEMKESVKPSGRIARTSLYQNTYSGLGKISEKGINIGTSIFKRVTEKLPGISGLSRKGLDIGGGLLSGAKNGIGKVAGRFPIFSKAGDMFKSLKNSKSIPVIGNLLGLASSAATIASASPKERGRETAGEIGSWIGSAVGTFIGGGLGSAVPGAGTVIGGVAGSMAGATWGEHAGEWIYDKKDAITSGFGIVKDFFADGFGFSSFNKNKDKNASRIANQESSDLIMQSNTPHSTRSGSIGDLGIIGVSNLAGSLIGGPLGGVVGGLAGGIGKTFAGEKIKNLIQTKTDSIKSYAEKTKALIASNFSIDKSESLKSSKDSKQRNLGIVGAATLAGSLIGGPIGGIFGGLAGGLDQALAGEKLTDWIQDKTDSITLFGKELWESIPKLNGPILETPVNSVEFTDESIPTKSSRVSNQKDITVKVEVKAEPKITIENHSELNSESDIVTLLKSYIREMTDDIGDELANKLTHVFNNMPEMEGV